jgi:hypothetical protein
MTIADQAGLVEDEKIDSLLSRRTAEVQGLARAMRALVRDAAPRAAEVIYHGALCYGATARPSTLKVYLSFHASHVNLGFYFGANLPDKDALLEGDGKRMRHIKIRSQVEIRKQPFQRLIKAALQQA